MRFLKFTYIASALILGLTDCVNGSTTLGTARSTSQYIGDISMSQARYIITHITRYPSEAVHIIKLPVMKFDPAMNEEDIRAVLRANFALVKQCLSRNSNLANVLIRGAESFDQIVASAPATLRQTVVGVLNQVIHETFDGLAGKTVYIDNMSTFPIPMHASTHGAKYLQTNTIIGPDPFWRLGSNTLIVTVAEDALSSEMARFISGLDPPVIGASAAAARPQSPRTVAPSGSSAVVVSAEAAAPSSAASLELSEEEQAFLDAFYAAESATAAAALAAEEQARIVARFFDDELSAAAAAALAAEEKARIRALVDELAAHQFSSSAAISGLSPEDQAAAIAALYAAQASPAAAQPSSGHPAPPAAESLSSEVRPAMPYLTGRLFDGDLVPAFSAAPIRPVSRAAQDDDLRDIAAAEERDRTVAAIWEATGGDITLFAQLLHEMGIAKGTISRYVVKYLSLP
jgi:hypothetical protein